MFPRLRGEKVRQHSTVKHAIRAPNFPTFHPTQDELVDISILAIFIMIENATNAIKISNQKYVPLKNLSIPIKKLQLFNPANIFLCQCPK